MNLALFVVGAPGVGKTTFVRALLGMPKSIVALNPKPKWTTTGGICAAGHYTGGTFDGADMVPYNGAADALAFWEENLARQYSLSVFDGDRFSNEKALLRIAERVKCASVLLTADEDTLIRHREARGSNQNASWMRGRATKAERFNESVKLHRRIGIEGYEPADLVVRVRQEFGITAAPDLL